MTLLAISPILMFTKGRQYLFSFGFLITYF